MLTEIPLRHFFFFHLEAVSGSRKGLKMAGGAFDASGLSVIIVAERNRISVFYIEDYVFSAFGRREGRKQQQ